MNTIIAAVITGSCTLGGVFLATRLQTRRIDADNRAALREQTGELKPQVKETPDDHR